ncbi:Protein NPAT [Frankliniella fusca]|uniref:Protein NPAT n=1 Tax=Frankliniella fusca TaxID=407009 RepID=A0AAE1L5F9_9NEOP|nr:Protein NPAT [Frankliniella fusca]
MEALLPSEIARLVLGYLEEEKCGEAAKCFLNTSPHLAEIRHISQKGKKYPTKVNGFSLKDVLDEYCMVHTIVQESVSSMSEQPNGTMIECLRSLVRACQPVQVHINLHPHQGQNASLNKSENPDLSSSSTRSKSRKPNSHGQILEGGEPVPDQQTTFLPNLPDSSSNQSLHAVASQPSHLIQQTPYTSAQGAQNIQIEQTSNTNMLGNPMELQIQGNSGLLSQSKQSSHPETNEASHQDTFQSSNIDSFQEPAPLLTPGQLTSQPLVHVSSVTQSSVTQVTSSEYTAQSSENNSMPSIVSETEHRDYSKTAEPARSYTVTKCFGSNIVILENDHEVHQPFLPSSAITSTNVSQADEAARGSRLKLPSPYKTKLPQGEQLAETALRTGMVTNIVEKLGGAMKTRDDKQELGEGCNFSDEAVQSVLKQIMEEPCFEQFHLELLQFDQSGSYSSSDDSQKLFSVPGERRKQFRKKNTGSESCTPSKVLSGKFLNTGYNFLTDRVTPAKTIVEGDTLTPFSKLLKSITSPSSENYLDPTQFAALIDIPGSAAKSKDQNLPVVPEVSNLVPLSQPSSNTDGTYTMVQAQPPALNYVVCHSNQQFSQYVNETGVNTLSTDEVQIVSPLVLPKVPMTRLPPPNDSCASKKQQAPKQKKKPSKPRVSKGARQPAVQTEPAVNEKAVEEKDTVTLYAAGGKDLSSTVSYSSSADMPILVSDEVAQTQPVDAVASDGHSTDSVTEKAPDELKETLNQADILAQPEIIQQPETEAQPERAEPEKVDITQKDDNFIKDDGLQSVNSSVNRNTPAFTGPRRPFVKRTSLSTPRRRESYVRALDFSTPTKENDQSLRRANTSPKNMSMNALSPRTAGKSGKPSVRESLFKAPDDGSQRTSKAKTHLFKSPDYIMSLSSGFKNPSAVTSTPCETNPGSNDCVVPLPSEAWDKVGGVGLILDANISPVKRKEPSCKKTLKSWDSDLRSLLSGSDLPPPPPPVPERKRKCALPAGKKKGLKKSKPMEKEEDTKADENSPNSTQDIANQSDSDMAKLIENNIMNSSSEATSPVKQTGISGVQTLPSPPKPECADNVSEMEVDEPEINHNRNEEKNEDVTPVSKIDDTSKPLNDLRADNKDLIAVDSSNPPARELISSQGEAVAEDSTLNGKIKTPVIDSKTVSIADKNCLSQVTWKESFSFDTPVKDCLANIVPQTPRLVDPSTASGEDTPRTKIIKALPFPFVQSAGTPIPTVPPTPTIHATPSVSPNGPAYFQPVSSSPISRTHPTARGQSDNLESILIQECSRMEASGIRQVPKKPVLCEVVINSSGGDSEESHSTDVKVQAVNLPGLTECDGQPECARLRCYQRKTKTFDPIVCETFPGLLSNAKSRAPTSGDDTDECLIISPKIYSSEQETCNVSSEGESHLQTRLPPFSEMEIVKSDSPSRPTSHVFSNIDGKIEEALNVLHGIPKKSSKMTPQKSEAITPLAPHRKSLSRKSIVTPIKTKTVRTKLPSSKKKYVMNDSVERTTDDESSGSSSSDDSSSDSDSNNSSSSSSDESSHDTNISLRQKIKCPSESDTITATTSKCHTSGIDKENSLNCPPKEEQDDRPVGAMVNVVSSSNAETVQNNCEENVLDQRQEVMDNIEQSSPNADKGGNDFHGSKEDATTARKDEAIASENEISVLKPSELTADENRTLEPLTLGESPKDFVAESNNSKESPKQTCENFKVNVDLKSVIETKDMGSCGKLEKSQNTLLTSMSSVQSELIEKRLRTIAQLKGAFGKKDTKKKGCSLSCNSGKPEVSAPNPSLDSKKVQARSKEPVTKDIAICKEVPKKRRSKSEADGEVCHVEPKDSIFQERIASDSPEGCTDDKEFTLHLSEDEKEETECDSNVAEVPGPHLPHEVTKINPVTTSNPASSSTHKVSLESKLQEVSLNTPKQTAKFVSKKVSSKAADDAIKALLEKGFNCVLPSLPTKKIGKIDPHVNKEVHQKKPVDLNVSKGVCHKKPVNSNVSKEVSLRKPADSNVSKDVSQRRSGKSIDSDSPKPSESTLFEMMSRKCNENPTIVDKNADSSDEEMSETINTSITSYTREVTVKYRGLGPKKPRIDVFPTRSMHIEMEDTSISLSLSCFFPLYNNKSKVGGNGVEIERSRHRLDSSRTDTQVYTINQKYVHCQDSRDNRGALRDSRSGDRVPSRHRRDDSRSRKHQSPPRRQRHSRDYSADRSHYRDQHGHHKSHERIKSMTKVDPSSHHRIHLSTRGAEPLKSSTKELRKDVEDGEIFSSDSELGAVTSSKRVRTSSQKIKQSVRENMAVKESATMRKKSNPGKSSSPTKENSSARVVKQHGIFYPPVGDERKSSGVRASISRKDHDLPESDETNDIDLDDDSNFPVLGDDNNDESDPKETEQNSSKESNSSGGMVLRRAPPRSVNAHKAVSTKTGTPTRSSKRKLSTSLDNVSEDSCQSSFSVVNAEGKQKDSPRRTKKRMSISTGKATMKKNENENVADCSEIIKNLNVDAFLSKIHG